MRQTVPPPAGPPEPPFSSERQTAPLAPIPSVDGDYVPDWEEVPTVPLPAVPGVAYMARQQRPSRRFSTLLAVILLLALTGTDFGSALVYSGERPTHASVSPLMVGHIYFLSSDQLSENSSQGICDEVDLDLDSLAPPAPGKGYYAWLLHDARQSEGSDMLLGTLEVNHGAAHLFYPGDAQHTNLLAVMSRFLVTEEDATVTPVNPSLDKSTWRYYAEFAQQVAADAPSGTPQFSYLDHLRHLLASDPLLDELELPGGLITWFYRNTGKVTEWATSLREDWEENKDTGFLRRQTTRMLTYLDGISYVQQDLPPGTTIPVKERLARIGLLAVQSSTQDPPAYLEHIVFHLDGLLQTSNAPGPLRPQVAMMILALSNVQAFLEQLRAAALQLLHMTDAQLVRPATLTLLNAMIDDATHAYVGQTDPITGTVHEGVTWIHDYTQTLAMLDITAYSGSRSSIQMIQDTHHSTAVHMSNVIVHPAAFSEGSAIRQV